MRTLKKTLCLVLAVVMMLGLCAFHAGATDFKDDADISAEYKEAAEVLTAVGVFKGDNGEFKPTKALTRAEGATLIARLLGYDETKLTGKSSFTDVPDWAQAAVAACETEGIIAGYGDGKFGPSDPLTGTAFSKMLLGVLGYDAEIESLVGADWEINTSKLAKSSGVGEDMLDVITNASINRQSAAQLCLNALKSDMVEYDDKGTTVTVGGATVITGAKKARSKTTTSAWGRAIDGDGATGTTNNPYTIQLGENLYNGDLKLTETSDEMGRPANQWKHKTKEIGKFSNTSDLLISATKKVSLGTVYDTIGKDAYDDLEAGLAAYKVFIDGADVTNEYKLANLAVKNSSGAAGIAANGVIFELYLTEDGARIKGEDADLYTFVMAYTYLVQATADYSKSNESVKVTWVDDSDGETEVKKPATASPKTEISQDNFNVADVKENDYLVVTYSVRDKSFQSVAKAEELVGEVTSYKNGSNMGIDGTTYEYNKTVGSNASHGTGVTPDVGSNVKVILDPYGYIVLVKDADYSSSYLFLKTMGSNTLKAEAEVYFLDGTSKTISIKKLTDKNNKSYTAADKNKGIQQEANKGAWYTYTVDSSDKYTLKYVSAEIKNTEYEQVKADPFSGAKDAVPVLVADFVKFVSKKDIKANSETVVLILDDDGDVTVYTGVSNIPDLEIKAKEEGKVYVSWTEKNGYAKYVFVDASEVGTKVDDSSSNSEYVFVVNNPKKKIAASKTESYAEVALYYNTNKTLVKNVKVNYDDVDDFKTGTLVEKVRTNSTTGFLTGANVVTNGKDVVVLENQKSNDAKISYSKGTISFGKDSYVLNTSRIVLIYTKDAKDLLEDKNATYELHEVNGSGLNSALSDAKTYEYSAWGIRNDSNSEKIDDLYIYITKATKAGAEEKPVASTELKYVGNDETDVDGYSLFYYVESGKTTPKVSDMRALLINGAGYKTATLANGEWTLDGDTTVKVTFTQVYKFTIDGTVYYVANGANIKDTGSKANVVLNKDGKYATVTLEGNYFTADNAQNFTENRTGLKCEGNDKTIVSGYYKVAKDAVALDTDFPAAGWTVTKNTTEQYINANKEITVKISAGGAGEYTEDALNTALGKGLTLKDAVAGVSVAKGAFTKGTEEVTASLEVTVSIDVSKLEGDIDASAITLAKGV